jgi:hypothetical protein
MSEKILYSAQKLLNYLPFDGSKSIVRSNPWRRMNRSKTEAITLK